MKSTTTLLMSGLLCLAPSAHARLEVRPESTVDLGGFPAESAPVASFELFNAGTNGIRILEAKTGCPCFEPVLYEKRIAPGGSTALDVFVDGKLLSGPFEKKIHLRIAEPAPARAEITVKGIARPAIDGLPKYVFAGRIPLGQPWSTNLPLHVRNGLTAKPALNLGGHSRLEGELVPAPDKTGLRLRMPPLAKPQKWKDRIVLSFPEIPAIPATVIEINGCCGGTLQASAQKLEASSGQATFVLLRIHPDGAAPRPAPPSCATPGVAIRETPLPEPGKSTVQLSFSKEFLRRLKKEKRIAVLLTAEGFVPLGLVVEWRP